MSERAQRILDLLRDGGASPEDLHQRVVAELQRALDDASSASEAARPETPSPDGPRRRDELERAERALRGSRALTEQILETVPGGIIVVSERGAVLRVNAEAVRFLGLSADELTARGVVDFSPSTFREDGSPCPVEEYPVARCLATREPQPPQVIGVAQPDGSIGWAVFTALPLTLQGTGEGVGAVATFLDVTEHKRTEQALRRSEARFRTLVQNLPAYVLTVDREAKIRYLNRAAPGVDLATAIGESAYAYLPAAFHPVLSEHLRMAFEAGASPLHEVQDLSGRWYASQIVSLGADEGGEPLAMKIASDITERKADEQRKADLEARIQQAQKLESLEVLASGVAHDFSNLLVGVLGNTELAMLKLPAESEVRGLVADARTAAMRASELTHQLLAYAGRTKVQVAPLDLNEVIEEMAKLLGSTISNKVTLRLELASDLPGVAADPTQVRQVVMNLITNASDALDGRPGTVAARTGLIGREAAQAQATYSVVDLDAGTYVYLEVADDGCGMDEANKARIFDPFFTTKRNGRGLGLAAVLGIVRAHQGAVTVRSSPGKGARFRVMFPSLDRPGTPRRLGPVLQHEEDARPRRGTVLVVDDEHHVRSVSRMALEGQGYRVLTAADGAEAVVLYAEHAAEVIVVILDYHMQDMDGVEVFDALRELRPDVPIVLSSGYGEEVAARRFAGRDLAGFLEKPYRLEQLAAIVERAAGTEDGAGAGAAAGVALT